MKNKRPGRRHPNQGRREHLPAADKRRPAPRQPEARHPPQGSGVRDLPSGALIVPGNRPCQEIIRHSPESIEKVYVARGDKYDTTLEQSFDLQIVDFETMNRLSRGVNHQGIIIKLKEVPEKKWKEDLRNVASLESSIIVALDGVQDPHNLGAILRAAEVFGVDAVMWSKNRCCGVTPTVNKVSTGASALLRLIVASNLVQALEFAKELGFAIYLAEADGDIELSEISWEKRSIIIFGSEESGARRLTERSVDFTFRIAQRGKLQSLNVSQSVAVVLSNMPGTGLR